MRRLLGTALYLLALFWLAACGRFSSSGQRQPLNVHASPASAAWLPEVFRCAEEGAATIRISDPANADLVLRIGEPAAPTATPFQIGVEEILIVAHPQGLVASLTAEEVRSLFLAGGADSRIDLWVFAPDEDVQQAFRETVMGGRAVSGAAHVAGSPEQMVQAVTNTPNAVGVLPRRWKTAGMRELFTAAKVPVLALVSPEPDGMVLDLVACLQAQAVETGPADR